jgi:hypothetical protein
MKFGIYLIIAILSSQAAVSQQIMGIFKINKSQIIVPWHHHPATFLIQTTDSMLVTINDHLLIIPMDSILITLPDPWAKTTENNEITYQMKAADYLGRRCSIEMKNLFHSKWFLKIDYRSFVVQYSLEQL